VSVNEILGRYNFVCFKIIFYAATFLLGNACRLKYRASPGNYSINTKEEEVCQNVNSVVLHRMEVVHIVRMESMNIIAMPVIALFAGHHRMEVVHTVRLASTCMEVMENTVSIVVPLLQVHVHIARMESTSVSI